VRARHASGALAQADVLVFATHGLVAGEAGAAAPGLVLTPPAEATAEDDGLLTAAEIATFTIGARLVVLSACNTAAGSAADGDGLSGLARGFFHAGAQSLLVTHWSVYSDSAVAISTGLFDEMRRSPGLSQAEALQRAIVRLLDVHADDPLRAHPAWWGPFALIGAD
jgi:CHAT domain-containing protein